MDFSTLDTLAGAVIAIAAMIVVGLVLLKYGVIRIGGSSQDDDRKKESSDISLSDDRQLRRADRAEIRDEIMTAMSSIKILISELREDVRDYSKAQQECQRVLPEKYIQWDAFNKILGELKEDRIRRWGKFDTHEHDDHSGVVIFKKSTC